MAAQSRQDLQIGDVKLHVYVDGEPKRETLLILHGLTDSSAGFRWLVPQFADRHRIVRFDFRGHGRSDRAEDYVTPDFLDDAVAVCERVARAACVLISHSWGGLIAAALAQRRPDLVRGVFFEDPLLVDPAVRTDLLGDDGVMIREFFEGPVVEFFAQVAKWQHDGLSIEEAADELASMPTPHGVPFSEVWFPEAVRSFAEGKLQFDLRVLDRFAAARQAREAEPLYDSSRPIDVPGLVLAGDPAIPGSLARPIDIERLRATSPKIDHEIIRGAGHGIHCERNSRETFTDALIGFLSGLDD